MTTLNKEEANDIKGRKPGDGDKAEKGNDKSVYDLFANRLDSDKKVSSLFSLN